MADAANIQLAGATRMKRSEVSWGQGAFGSGKEP